MSLGLAHRAIVLFLAQAAGRRLDRRLRSGRAPADGHRGCAGEQAIRPGPNGGRLAPGQRLIFGALANHIWSVNAPDDRDQVNSTFVQPFLTYTTPNAWTFALNSESTYDWNAEQWTVPINASVSKLVKFGDQPVSLQLGGHQYVEGPEGQPDWGLRFGVTFLFPK